MKKEGKNRRKLTRFETGQGARIEPFLINSADSNGWRLPSGITLAEFALQAGFVTPLLFGTECPLEIGSVNGTGRVNKGGQR